MKIYVKALKEELDLGKVREVNDREMMFYNKTFIMHRKDGRLRKIIDCRPINKRLGNNNRYSQRLKSGTGIRQVVEIPGFWLSIPHLHLHSHHQIKNTWNKDNSVHR
ncbi:MAG: hypothetical protein EZS28_038239 [Streblomastix strix]|uniref:Uncharacterized protein n=1 Tax=Streblomastix strix TaxID=222440 RepID=A0A5J4U959_9EUKA|nr:MAG: hypothetical protein EZS28_038239 [Streblomastix strix]